jgi:Zn-finger nucleic acid-binding protein
MSDTSCPGCGLLYDLAAYRPGQRCRCRCGQVLIAPDASPPPKIARTIHCSACGGNLEQGRPDCPYCKALVDLTDARMAVYCGACLSMNKEGAAFCSDCGERLIAIASVETPEATDRECPRCRALLRRRALGGYRPLECPVCCGLFVAATDLEALIAEQEKKADASAAAQAREPERASLAPEDVAYLKCPVCRTMMNRMNYGRFSGVIIDTCKPHGHWLDPGELEKIARWVVTGGLAKLRKREIEELRAECERLTSERLSEIHGPLTARLDTGKSEPGLWGGWCIADILIDLFD